MKKNTVSKFLSRFPSVKPNQFQARKLKSFKMWRCVIGHVASDVLKDISAFETSGI